MGLRFGTIVLLVYSMLSILLNNYLWFARIMDNREIYGRNAMIVMPWWQSEAPKFDFFTLVIMNILFRGETPESNNI